METKKKASKKKKILIGVLLGILAVILIIAAVYGIKIWRIGQNSVPITDDVPTDITPAPSPSLEPIEGEPADIGEDYQEEVSEEDRTNQSIYQKVPIDENVINILLVGIDARPGETSSRSDTMMLFSYDRTAHTARLVSFLRDTWVYIPGHDWNRINAAHAYGGVGLTINTLNENFDLDIQNYITINFEQFIRVIDILGGVEVNLTDKEIDYINKYTTGSPIESGPGMTLLDGEKALIHCRNRKTGGGDFERTRRQRETMLAIFNQVSQERNIATMTGILTNLLDNIQTNMPANELFTIGTELFGQRFDLAPNRIPFDGTWRYADKDGRSVITIDIEENTRRLHAFLYGEDA